jgi:hypothetical protein
MLFWSFLDITNPILKVANFVTSKTKYYILNQIFQIICFVPLFVLDAMVYSRRHLWEREGIQQQTALAQPVDPRDIGEDEIDVGDIRDTVRDILEQVDVDDDESVPNCPPPLAYVRLPIDNPELFICVLEAPGPE